MDQDTSALALVHSRNDVDLAERLVSVVATLGARAAVFVANGDGAGDNRTPQAARLPDPGLTGEPGSASAGELATGWAIGPVIGAHGSPLVAELVGQTVALEHLEQRLRRAFDAPVAIVPCAPEGRAPHAHLAIVGLEDPRRLMPVVAAAGEVLGRLREHRGLREQVSSLEERLAAANAQIERHEERDRITYRDLYEALCFQRAMLPRTTDLPGVDLDVMYLPAEIVSGDIYDVVVLRDGTIRIFVADAAGHGVAAALTTMFIKSQYDQLRHGSVSPAELLASLNDAIAAYGRPDMRFTAICADVRPDTGKVVYATAAHPAPLLVDGATPRWLWTGGTFLGMTSDIKFPEREETLGRGATLYFITDGLVEATDAKQVIFGEERVAVELAISARAAESASLRLVPALAAFVGEGRSLSDDITLVGVRLA